MLFKKKKNKKNLIQKNKISKLSTIFFATALFFIFLIVFNIFLDAKILDFFILKSKSCVVDNFGERDGFMRRKGRIYAEKGTDLCGERDGFMRRKGRIYAEKGTDLYFVHLVY
ncbi:hypothetical protein A9308_08970 [Moraxella atlantae]|uniref:Uncharacterized protein n=1 Tax=Faucicola atlantae TaxID=34059 RepID=A0A1B8QAK7_9GAMM|nr:hypothetical protein A9308_08970 [Moraxella atlantae]